MFGKLKDKLKGAFKKFSKSVEEEGEDVVEPVISDLVKSVPAPKAKPKTEDKVEVKHKVEKPISKEVKSKPNVAKEKPVLKVDAKPKVKEVVETLSEPEVIVEDEPVNVVFEPVVEDKSKIVDPAPDEAISEEPKEKKGFFKKLFTKSDAAEIEEIEQEEIQVLEDEVEAISEIKSLEKDFEGLPDCEKLLAKDDKDFLKEEISKEILDEEKIVEDLENKKSSIFSKVKDSITKKKISEDKFEELFFEIEVALLESNVSFDVVEKIKTDLKTHLVNNPIPRGEIMDVILDTLKGSIEDLFKIEGVDLISKTDDKKPLIISLIGVNGSGKTTQLAKLAKKFQDAGKSVVIGACDTFRAAAIHQLEEHANNLGIKMIKHDYGADAAAVAFDTISHAKSKGIDVVLLDTAGRLHSNVNLMRELEKLMKISNPDFNIFVGESITGNDCVEQATLFGESVRIDGIILTKADVDDKGGAALSISYVTKKPILYFGTGQGYADLVPFSKKLVMDNLGLD